ncbi:MAG: type I-E CRISPR-associated protein Cas7/Cse4/CasC [Desulfovibrio sp.]|jgi:CRISPR system Cascade subunit CasC|nr:type I-E CRISPR-associated protein Cas7/Cse4/CasC [Desulfovibrio sp.]
MSNPFTGRHIEYHILQSFPVTCLNRDDVGAPKTAEIGGVTRARVSSQSWKRQVRMQLHTLGVRLGVRTKQLEKLIREDCLKRGAGELEAQACAANIADALATDTLFFFSLKEAAVFGEYAQSQNFSVPGLETQSTGSAGKGKKDKSKKAVAKDIAGLIKKVVQPRTAQDGLDIALFGRMVAQAPEMNIEGASSFAHAVSIHKVSNEVEFFTALDDLQSGPESAHMGSLEFNSAVYYRYISLDLGQLHENIGAEDMDVAVEVFTKALYLAVPAARQNTMSGAASWDYARILGRRGQRLQASFDNPVLSRGEGYVKPGIVALEEFLALKERQAGSLFCKELDLKLGPDKETSVDDITAALKDYVRKLAS